MSLQPISSTYNQLNPSTDMFNFTGLTRDDIIAKLNAIIAASKFKNTTESAFAKLMLNSIAGMIDINNYNIQRRAEEAFFDTAKLKSSYIGLARNLGYDVQRPTPATGIFSLTVTWNASSELSQEIVLTSLNPFSFRDNSYVNEDELKFTIVHDNLSVDEQTAKSYTVTPDDLYNYVVAYTAGDTTGCKVIFTGSENDIDYAKFTMIQGEFKYTKIFAGTEDTNNQFGKKFQQYKINDPSFSDYYGSNDFKYDATADNNYGLFTKVAIASDALSPTNIDVFTANNTYEIERRSLLRPELVNEYNFINPSGSFKKICLIRTAKDQTVDLKFGDGMYIALGLDTANTAIFIKYLSTNGAAANVSYIKDETIDLSFSPTLPSGISITPIWYSNSLSNGLDIESNESIEVNAPAIYSSLDRLVTKSDFQVFLRKKGYKNVIIWGEAEERQFFKEIMQTSVISSDVARRLFNVMMFSVTRPLYTSINNNWSVATLDQVNDLDPVYNYELPFASDSKNIYNIMMRQDYITNDLEITAGNLRTLIDAMMNKATFTLRPVYVSPFIYDFIITGNVKIESFVNAASIKVDIQNKLYAYLNDINDFNSEIKISNLTEIINSFNGVKYSDIKIVPSESIADHTITLGDLETVTYPTISSALVSDVLISAINTYLSKYNNAPNVYYNAESATVTVRMSSSVIYDNSTYKTSATVESNVQSLAAITMRNFIFELVPLLMSIGTQYSVNTTLMNTFINELYHALSHTIKMNMLDSNGNISPEYNSVGKRIRGGYSLGNEIIRLNIDSLTIKY